MNALANIIALPFPMQPKRFEPPTFEEVTEHASQIGMSVSEAQKFWYYYDANGWKVGKSPMQKWKSALAGWNLRVKERIASTPTNPNVLSIQNQKALERVEERIKYLKGQFPLREQKQKNEWNELKTERNRLLGVLGFKA